VEYCGEVRGHNRRFVRLHRGIDPLIFAKMWCQEDRGSTLRADPLIVLQTEWLGELLEPF
jgi:hypothetical protein